MKDNKLKNIYLSPVFLMIIIFIGIFIIYLLSSPGHTTFNHFTLLADAFLKGNLYIDTIAPWLEKIPLTDNKFYVANPPMPAILAMIPVLIFGANFPQDYLAYLFGGLISIATFVISRKFSKHTPLAIWSSFLITLGTINWYLSSIGSTWYLAHLVSQLFLSLAILSGVKNKNPILAGLFLGFSYLSRIPTILSFPFFLAVYFSKKEYLKSYFLLFLGVLPSIVFNFFYNYARFGVIWDIGYTMIPGVSSEPWYAKGVVHPSYIVEHLKIIFLSLPDNIRPHLGGYAIWFTTPAFIFAFWSKIKEKIVWSSWLSILMVSLLIFSHGSTGFSQFGYRFACDFYPFLALLTIKGVNRLSGPKWYHWLVLLVSIFVNFWGILMLNKFN